MSRVIPSLLSPMGGPMVYEHFARTYASKADHTGTAHIVIGNAGDREFPYAHAWAYPMLPFEHKRIAEPSGFGILNVPNATTMVSSPDKGGLPKNVF